MNVLVVSAVLPYPLFSGGQVRLYNLLKRLSKKHKITLVSFIRDEKENSFVRELSFCQAVHTIYRGRAWQPKYILRTVISSSPFLFETYRSSHMRDLLTTLIQKNSFDLVHLEPSYVKLSIPQTTLPLVVSEHNLEFDVYDAYVKKFSFAPLRPILSIDVAKMKKAEIALWGEANRVTAVSQYDRDYIRKHTKTPVTVVENGVDLATFPFKPKEKIDEKKLTFLFVGNFMWLQNRDALHHLVSAWWPRIKDQYPGSVLRVVGKRLPEYMKVSLPKDVHYFEHVNSIGGEYQSSDMLVAPIFVGGGTKYKVLEAMASGLPVITTAEGIKGLAIAHDRDVQVVGEDEGITVAVQKMLVDKERTNQVKRARLIVEKRYSWDTIAATLETVWKEASS